MRDKLADAADIAAGFLAVHRGEVGDEARAAHALDAALREKYGFPLDAAPMTPPPFDPGGGSSASDLGCMSDTECAPGCDGLDGHDFLEDLFDGHGSSSAPDDDDDGGDDFDGDDEDLVLPAETLGLVGQLYAAIAASKAERRPRVHGHQDQQQQ